MLDWLVVGGGVHGTHLSLVLTERVGVPRSRLRVLDPHQLPLARWTHCTRNTGMTHLRSSLVHHIGLHPFDLKHFAREVTVDTQPAFAHPYKRPALELFQHHARTVIREHTLEALRLQGHATSLHQTEEGWRVETDRGMQRARRVLLALGLSDQPRWPAWAADLRADDAPVNHLFAPTFRRPDLPDWEHAVVVGGGMSGVQAALAWAEAGQGRVTLLMRHEFREYQLDADPGWMSIKQLDRYHQEPSYERRRQIVDGARRPGSVTPALAQSCRYAVRCGALDRVVADIEKVHQDEAGLVQFTVDGDTNIPPADRVLLATGFESAPPGGPWLQRAADRLSLPKNTCGFPIVNERLEWAPGLHVTGPLAELEIGPVARNIVGARLAGKRLARLMA